MQTDPELPILQPSLADQVCEIILRGISDGSYTPGSLLPSENQLAEQYSVSRSTIRAAFARLVEQGFVKRKRGVGTFVAESPNIVDPLYQQLDAYDRIAAQGYEPGSFHLKSEIIEVGDRIAEKLSVKAGSAALLVQKVLTANKKPVIYFVSYIPHKIFQEHLSMEQVLKPGITEPFYKFFPRHCNTKVKYLTSKINSEIAENCQLPDVFDQLEPNTPILVMENVGFGENDNPLFFSLEYLVGEESAVHVIRHADDCA